jgi:hypothetical protein
MTLSYTTAHSCFIVKNNNVADTIVDSTRVPGALNSYAWKISKQKCLPGETVSFHNSWSEDSHHQGEVIETFSIGDRTAIVFKPNNKVFKKEFLKTEISSLTHGQEKAFFSTEQLNLAIQNLNFRKFISKLDGEDLDYNIGSWEDMTWFDDRKEGSSIFKYPIVPGSFRVLGSEEVDLHEKSGTRNRVNEKGQGTNMLGEIAVAKSNNNNHTLIGQNGFYVSKCSNGNIKPGMTVLVIPSKRAMEKNSKLSNVWVKFVAARTPYHVPEKHLTHSIPSLV